MVLYPIESMYGIYANIGGIVMVNVTIYGIHGSYGYIHKICIYKLYIYMCVCMCMCDLLVIQL